VYTTYFRDEAKFIDININIDDDDGLLTIDNARAKRRSPQDPIAVM
jgi:hypothetical protein